ncbi:ribonuclease H-like domain-containing protein [Rhizophagus irregularis DAOM 181602=DAOM 197198]|nr:ribonuclease H-like domain-containing protein [Rhizophagus irregularis DAOM 181602=DAOM 197198]
MAVTPLHTLRTQAFTFSKHRLVTPNVLPSTVLILSTLDSYLNVNSEIFNNSINLNLNIFSSLFINNIFIGNRDLIIQLLDIAKQFLLRKNFTFYTDETSDATPNSGPPPPSYKGALSFNPSSTKAEVYALLTAIIAVPDYSELDVFTDSLNVIHTFHVVTKKLTSIRRILKCNNHLAWRLIDILITKKSLIVRLHKVKAHSNDHWNDMADGLANAARQLAPYEINPTNLPDSLMTPIWASIAPIDRDIRKFCHNLTDVYTFDRFLGNPSLSPIFDRFPLPSIHWPLTRAWLQFNSTPDVCSSTKSSHNAFKIKALNHILPCGDVLTKHYPDLYPDNYIPCPVCNNHQDTNEHLGICSNLLPVINKVLVEHKRILQRLLEENTSYNPILISQSIDHFELLTPISDSNSYNHPIYLIIHQLISQDLYNFVRSFIFNDKLTRLIIWEFLISFHEHIYQEIWPKHCSLLKLWEQHNGITPKCKRDFRRKKPKKSRDQQLIQPTAQPRVASSSHHGLHNLSHPRTRMNSSPSDGISSRSFHPWTSTAPSTHPLHLPHLPMWLILCTCNFLHSGGWLSSVRHPSSSELDIDNFSSSCNFKFNFFCSSFSFDSTF